jgi:hypothetical protein
MDALILEVSEAETFIPEAFVFVDDYGFSRGVLPFYVPESRTFDLEFRLSMVLRLIQERKRLEEQARFRARLMLTFIFVSTVIFIIASVAYSSVLATHSTTFLRPPAIFPPRLFQRYPWILGGILPELTAGLTVALSALTLARVRKSTRTMVQDEVLRTYRSLVIQNKIYEQQYRGLKR